MLSPQEVRGWEEGVKREGESGQRDMGLMNKGFPILVCTRCMLIGAAGTAGERYVFER